MNRRIVFAGVVPLAVYAVLQTSALTAQSAPQSRSVREGVYNDAQLKRGMEAYEKFCASCHGPDLSGGEIAPALFGSSFMANWNGLTVGDVFERIRISMPPDNPERVNRAQVVDIVSAILSANGFPAGKEELDSRAEVLKQIKIEASHSGSE